MTKNGNSRFFYGYVIIAVAIGIQMVGWGVFNTFGVFFNPLQNEFGWSRATISSVASLSLLMQGFISIFVGNWSDRFGPRLVVTVCGVFFGLGYLLMSRVSTLWHLYLLYTVIVGIGASAFDVVLLSTIARWFTRKRGIMTGVAKVGSGLGMLVMPLVAGALISSLDWRKAYIILGALALVFIVLVAQLLRRDPAEMHLLPDGEREDTAVNVALPEAGSSLREAIRTRQFWTLCAAYFTIVFCTFTIWVHSAPHAIDLGTSVTQAAGVLSVIGAASVVGRLTMGNAGDRIGSKRAMLICFVILFATLLWLLVARELWMLYLFAAIYGFAHGGFFALISPMVAGLFGTGSHGAIFGLVIFAGTIGGAIGPILGGYIFDTTRSYQLVFIILAVLSVIGLVLMSSLKPILRKGG